MGRAVEVGTGYLTLAVETSGVAAGVAKQFGKIEGLGADTGRKAGKAFAKGFETAKPVDISEQTKKVEQAQATLDQAVERSSKTRREAARKVEIAELKLNELRDSGRAKLSQLATAEDRVKAAREQYIAVSRKGVGDLQTYQAKLESTRSELDKIKRANEQAEQAAQESVGAFQRMGTAVQDAFKGNFKGAFASLKGESASAAGAVEGDFNTAGSQSGDHIKSGIGGAWGRIKSDASSTAGEVESEFSSAGSSAGDGFASNFQKAAGPVMAVAAGAGLGLGLTDGIMQGMERGQLNDKLAAQLDLSAPKAELAGQVAGSLYADAYGESLEDVNVAVGAVMSSIPGMMDAPRESLELVTSQALDLANAFDVDVAEATAVVGTLISNGLVADAEEGMDLITATMQRLPAHLRDEAFPLISEYGKHFSGLGISGEEMGAMIVAASENGTIGMDKMGDAVKEFQIRSTDMTKASGDAYATLGLNQREMTNQILAGGDAAQGAFGTIVEELLAIEDPATQAEAAIALFGTPLEDLGVDQIPAFLNSLAPVPGALGDVEGAAGRMGDTLNDNAATALESIKRSISTGFVDLLGNGALALQGLGESLAPLGDFLDKHRETWEPFAIGIGLVTAAVVGYTVVTKILTSALWGQAAAWVAANAPLAAIVVAIGLVVGAVIWAYRNIEWFRDLVDTAWAKIKEWTAALALWWTETAFPALMKAVDWLGDKMTWLWQNIIKPVWDTIKFLIAVAVGSIIGSWNLLKLAVDTWLAPMFTWLWEKVIKPLWTWIQDKIASVVGVVIRLWGNTKDELQWLGDKFGWLYNKAVKPMWDWIRDKIVSGYESIRDKAIKPLIDWIENKISPAFKAAREAIKREWDKLEGIMRKPVKFFVETVYMGNLRPAINKILTKVGLEDKHLPAIYMTGRTGFTEGIGGEFRKGGYTGNRHRDEVAGLVHGQEQVIRAESTAEINHAMPGFLDELNARGAGALSALTNPAHMAVGASVYNGRGSFTNPLQHAIANTGRLYVNGHAPGWGLNAAVGMMDRATSAVKVQRGSGYPRVDVNAMAYPAWWAGYYSGTDIMLNNAVMGGGATMAKQTVAAHEIGHALGLPHSDPSGLMSIMSYANMFSHNSATAADVRALSAIYGGKGTAGGGIDMDALIGPVTRIVDNLYKRLTDFDDGLFGQLVGGIAKYLGKGVWGHLTPQLMDSGGRLEPGLSLIENQTGTTEAILTRPQWDAMYRIADDADQGGGVHFHGNITTQDPEELFREAERRERIKKALRR